MPVSSRSAEMCAARAIRAAKVSTMRIQTIRSRLDLRSGLSLITLLMIGCSGDGSSAVEQVGQSFNTNERFILATSRGIVERANNKQQLLVEFEDSSIVLDPA